MYKKTSLCTKNKEITEVVEGRVQKELGYTKRLVEELKLGLEKVETQEAQSKQDSHLADLRLKEMEQGFANGDSVVAKTQLELAKKRHTSAVAELKSVKEELETIKKEYDSLVHERDIAVRRVEDFVSTSKEIEKNVEDLTLELTTIKELLESAHSVHLEAEEQRIRAVMALDQDKLNWEKELKQAEGELQQLHKQLLLTNDLKSKLERGSTLLVSLKTELSSYIEAKRIPKIKSNQGLPASQAGEMMEIETNAHAALATTTKELEEVRTNIEKANDEINCLRVAVSSLKCEVEKEKAALTTVRQREGLVSVSIASLEAELYRINTELDLALTGEREAREKMVELPKTLQRAAEEADQAKLVANLARDELRKAKEEEEQAKARVTTMEMRLKAALKETEAARASGKLANSGVKALEDSEQANMESDGSSNGITLPIEEYYKLSKKASEYEEVANKRVISAVEQIKAAKGSKSRSSVKLEEANKIIKEKKNAQGAAAEKAGKAKEAKLGEEQELRTWGEEHEHQQRKFSSVSHSLSNPSNLYAVRESESTASETDATNGSSTGSPSVHTPRTNAGNASSDTKGTRSFLSGIMFLARKKVQSLKQWK